MTTSGFPHEGKGSYADVPDSGIRLFAAIQAGEGGWVFKAYNLEAHQWIAREAAHSEANARELAEQWAIGASYYTANDPPLDWKQSP